jgi:ankyrin repeat protein
MKIGRGVLRHSGLIALIAVAARAFAADSCPVDEGLARFRPVKLPARAATAMATRQATQSVVVSPHRGGSAGVAIARSEVQPATGDPKYAQNARIMAVVGRRDLQGFLSEMPADPAQREALVERSLALQIAVRVGAPSIVRQILAWNPDALRRLSAESRTEERLALLQDWVARTSHAGEAEPTTGEAADHLETLRLVLDGGVDLTGRSAELWSVATLPSSPEMMAAARLLLDHHATINGAATNPRSPLAQAAVRSNVDLIQLMLSRQRPDQMALDEAIASTPIKPSNRAVPLLLQAGAHLDTKPENLPPGVTSSPALWHAANYLRDAGGREFIQLLIQYKADPNRTINRTSTPLLKLIDDPELVRLLLEAGADPNFVNVEGDTALHLALRRPEGVGDPDDTAGGPAGEGLPRPSPQSRARVAGLLLDHGADPNARDRRGFTPLMETRANDDRSIDLLVAKGAQIDVAIALAGRRNSQVPIGPVSWALTQGNDSLANALLGASGKPGPDDCGAPYYAAQTGSVRTLIRLLDAQVDLTRPVDAAGMTPIMQAAMRGEAGAVALLLERHVARVDEATPSRTGLVGGQVQQMMPGKITLLMAAAARNQKDVAEELLRRGARVDLRDDFGKTALTYALEADARDAASLLYAHGARP